MSTIKENQPQPAPSANKTKAFAVVLLLYEILVCFLYGYFFGYNSELFTRGFDVSGLLLSCLLALMTVVGFGLLNGYVTSSSGSAIGFSLFIFALTVQNFFFMRAFWNKASVNNLSGENTFSDQTYNVIGFSNYQDDRQLNSDLPTASLVDAIACAISMLVAVSPIFGKVGIFELFILTLFGPFFYELNSEILYRLYITDTGYGMRILILGSFLGLIITCILGKRETTLNHPNYKSQYVSRALSLLGFGIVFCAYPLLCVASLLTYTEQDGYILYVAPVNMFLALMAGILGCYTAAAFLYRKFSVHDLIFCGLTGGFVFSSSSDINFNPAVPLILGYAFGFLSSMNASNILKNSNDTGVLYTYSHLQRFVIPGIFSCVLSAIMHGVGEWTNGGYGDYIAEGRSATGQGAFQLLGLVISAAIGVGGGLIIGLLIRLVNNHRFEEQFNDSAVYTPIISQRVEVD